jgi:hypothetical protein
LKKLWRPRKSAAPKNLRAIGTGNQYLARTGRERMAFDFPRCLAFGEIRRRTKNMSVNQAALDVAQRARYIAAGYALHIAASRLAPLVDGKVLVRLIADYPIDSVPRKDGTKWTFDTMDALGNAVARKAIREEFPRIWLTGSLLAVGDALKDNDYFDHAPELELVRHLRNGIAHGNRFDIQYLDELTKYPAHNRDAMFRTKTIFEIKPECNGQPVLFDFMDAGDVLDLLSSVAIHLDGIGRGEHAEG